jgi:glycosyltransferase involved in cell wall biosynthesis
MKNTHVLSNITLPPDVDLLFAGCDKGSDPQVWELTQNNIKHNKNMYYIGPYYGQDKVDLIHSVDAVIFPSSREPFGIVGLEALVAGKILIASNVDGMRDYLNENNHISCGTTNESIKEGIINFLNKTKDQLQNMREQGFETARKLDWKHQAAQYEQVYDLLLK